MSVMGDNAQHARPTPRGWTVPQSLLAAVLVVLGTGITVVAFRVIWSTVTDVVRPSMHRDAWTVPVACEIAFVFMFLLGVLLAWRKAPPVASRGLIMAGLIAGSVELNVYASRGNVPALVAHLVVTGAFYSCLLAGKAAITAIKGGKVRADRIGAAEWLLHPWRSAALWWWMHAWGEPSRDRALARYQRLLYARAVAQSDRRVGRTVWLWRRRLPLTLRFDLSQGILPGVALDSDGWQQAITEHVAGQLRLLDRTPRETPAAQTDAPPSATTENRQPGRQKAATSTAADRAKANAKAKRLLSATPKPTLADVADKTGLSERTVSRINSKMPDRLQSVGG